MKYISVSTFKEILTAEKDNPSIDFINVCEPSEYKEKHIEGVRNVPLREIEDHFNEFQDKKTIYIHCRTDNRANIAIKKLESTGITAELVGIKGGIVAWDKAGHTTNSLTDRLPIMRQVFIAAGTLILIGAIGSQIMHQNFIYLTAFVGFGLLFSGISGWCGMAYLLAKMPWNK